jgi:hypothetical protein
MLSLSRGASHTYRDYFDYFPMAHILIVCALVCALIISTPAGQQAIHFQVVKY